MASSQNLIFANIVVFVILVCHSRADLIGDICSRSTNAALCNKALRSDPRSKGAKVKVLGEIIIDKSISALEVATNVFKSVEAKFKGSIGVCLITLDKAVEDLNTTRKALEKGERGTAIANSSGASTDIQTCNEAFEESGKTQPPRLKQANQYALDLIYVVQIISNLI